jgi:hypothetical protein
MASANGRLKASELRAFSTNKRHKAIPAASKLFDAMSHLYKEEFGAHISITDSYRSYDQQVKVKKAKGWLAATPGTSNHGWGRALDLGGGINVFGSKQRNWIESRGKVFGWVSPAWAQKTGYKPEPWHYEFTQPKTKRVKALRVSNIRRTPAGPIVTTIKTGFAFRVIVGSEYPKGGYTWMLTTGGRWIATTQFKSA